MKALFNNRFLHIIFVVILFLMPLKGGAETDRIVMRGSDNYPPFEFINDTGQPDGFNVDIVRAVMKDLGYDYDLKLENWDTVVTAISDRKIDVVIGMIYSQERAEKVRFTLPTCVIQRNFITRKKDNLRSIDDLRDKEIVVENGGWFHSYLLETKLAAKIIESDNIYESLKLLDNGKHDAVLASEMVAYHAMKRLNITDLHIGDIGVKPQSYSIAVNRNREDLHYEFNIALQRLKSSGEYDQIYNKWFEIYEKRDFSLVFLISISFFLFLVALLLTFIWLLRKQVSKATHLLNYSKQEVGIAIDARHISAWTYSPIDRTISALHGKPFGKEQLPIEEVYKLIHPEDILQVQTEMEALVSGKKESAVSFRVFSEKRSDYRYYETKAVRVEATREYPSHIVGTLKDVTDEKEIRIQLEDFRIKSELIVMTNGIILMQYDLSSRMFIRINDIKTSDQYIYSAEEYIGNVYPEDRHIASAFIAVMDKAEQENVENEFRIIVSNGEYDWFTISATAHKRDEAGKIISYIGLRQNNTKWKTINNDLIVLREKAEASNKLKSAFLANMSHEIRTPLNAIIGFSELLVDCANKEERDEFIEIIKTNNALLLQLINDVLDLSRIEAGHINLSYTTFNFSDYFSELAKTLSIKSSEKVKLRSINRYENLMTYTDQHRVTQIITNFVTNAFKFTKQGEIVMDYTFQEEGIKVTVSDTGIGISEESTKRVFDRFEKLNDFAQGTGLGLSICKVIIEALQGEIGVESELGKGSSFWFRIPLNAILEPNPDESPVQGISLEDVPLLSSSLTQRQKDVEPRGKTILIAEDIDNNYIILCSILRERYRVIRACNGIEAVEKARTENPNIILMDMKMPLMDGLQATQKIRQFNLHVPIIALTAYVFDTNRQDALRVGCNEFLSKPINKSVLMEILDSCQ